MNSEHCTTVLWIGIVLMPIRIRISMLMPIQIRMDPDWDQHDADPHADPTPSFSHVRNSIFFPFLSQLHSFASLQCFVFLSSVKDWQAFDVDPDPDPQQWCTLYVQCTTSPVLIPYY